MRHFVLHFLICVVGVATDNNGYNELPDHVKVLLERNTGNARAITDVPYFLEVRSTVVYQAPVGKPDGVPFVWQKVTQYYNSPAEFVWREVGESYELSQVNDAVQNLGEISPSKILESRDQWSHIDYRTDIVRTSSFMRLEGRVERVNRFDDPCTPNSYLGSIRMRGDEMQPNQGLNLMRVLAPKLERGSQGMTASVQTFQESFKSAKSIVYVGSEIVHDQHCEIVEIAESRNNEPAHTYRYWLASEHNGVTLKKESKLADGKQLRAVCRGIIEVAPNVYVGTDYLGYTLSPNADNPAENEERLTTRYQLVKLDFDPTEWPHASEDNFGFRFPENSIVQSLLTTPPSSLVIGNNIDDVLFTFTQMPELERWCSEQSRDNSRNNENRNDSQPVSHESIDLQTILFVFIGAALLVALIFVAKYRMGGSQR